MACPWNGLLGLLAFRILSLSYAAHDNPVLAVAGVAVYEGKDRVKRVHNVTRAHKNCHSGEGGGDTEWSHDDEPGSPSHLNGSTQLRRLAKAKQYANLLPPTTPLVCTTGFPGKSGSESERCLHGNTLNDGYAYVYNSNRGTASAACGRTAKCWCCRRVINTGPRPLRWGGLKRNTGCSNWRTIKMGSTHTVTTAYACGMICRQHRGCIAFGFQRSAYCNAGGIHRGACVLWNDQCHWHHNSCWEEYHMQRVLTQGETQPSPAPPRHATGNGVEPAEFSKPTGTFKERCLHGNLLNDGYEYVYNTGRGTSSAACGPTAEYWCCRRKSFNVHVEPHPKPAPHPKPPPHDGTAGFVGTNGYPTNTGSDKAKCMNGNLLRDGYEYMYNEGRGTPHAKCGQHAEYWCCRRLSLSHGRDMHDVVSANPVLVGTTYPTNKGATKREKCLNGNALNDGFEYVFNGGRGTPQAACGHLSDYWCCRRPLLRSLQPYHYFTTGQVCTDKDALIHTGVHDDCQAECNKYTNCKYYISHGHSWCALYKSCNEKEHAVDAFASTYAKNLILPR